MFIDFDPVTSAYDYADDYFKTKTAVKPPPAHTDEFLTYKEFYGYVNSPGVEQRMEEVKNEGRAIMARRKEYPRCSCGCTTEVQTVVINRSYEKHTIVACLVCTGIFT
jgi:hypothetical protein